MTSSKIDLKKEQVTSLNKKLDDNYTEEEILLDIVNKRTKKKCSSTNVMTLDDLKNRHPEDYNDWDFLYW